DNHPDVELVNISYENEEQSIEDMLLEALEEYPDTAGIFCTNENVTESVLETVGRLEDKEIKIVGFDAGEVQIQAIRDGREYGTVCQNPYGIWCGLRAASGQTVDNWIDPGYQWVDRSNIDVEEKKNICI
ncbi:MAG: substrate-binding domain-containing protein, partial [Eisenbergiella sp.]